MKKAETTVVVSVDVEDWPQSSWDRSLPLSGYCADNTMRVLDILAEFPVARATFFVLGKFAEEHPNVVRAIAQAGHEVGSHGHGHVELFHLGREKFEQDLRRSTQAIRNACGARPEGYRAPDFSVVGETLWALDVLAEQGYEYDTSIFPVDKGRYGIAGWTRNAARVRLQGGRTILEVPPATFEVGGKLLPAGGGYARLMPGVCLTWGLRRAARQLNFPPVFYCHPYEFDPGEFRRLDLDLPAGVRLHQGIGRRRSAAKLRRILKRFECISLTQARQRWTDLPEIDPQPFARSPDAVKRPPIFEGTKAAPSDH